MNEERKRIIYFSPTGGCRAIAEAIASVKEELVDITLSEARTEKTEFYPDEKYVFVFPVYNHNIPDVCADYIKKADGRNARAVVICVYGGVSKGRSLENAAGLLAASNFRPERGAYVPAPHFYSPVKLNLLTDGTADKLSAFVNGDSAVTKTVRYTRRRHKSAQKILKAFTGKCKYVSDLCTACGACRAACPVDAIDGAFNAIGRNCILCGACVRACGNGARKIKFLTPLPRLYIGANMRERAAEFFITESENS